MKKDELEKELKKTQKLLEKEKKNNTFLLKQQNKYVDMAQKNGSELAPYKNMVIRLEEELTKLKKHLKTLGDK